MRGLSRQFRRRVADDLEMFTNQPFTSPLTLGDIGSIEQGRFETSTAPTLQSLGISPGSSLAGPEFAIRWLSNRQGTTTLTVKAMGTPPVAGLAEAETGLHLQFGRKGSYYFEAKDAVISRIEQTPRLHREIAQARRQGRISRHDRIVMEVCQARRATLFMAQTRGAELTLSASAAFTSIVDTEVTFNTRRSKGSVLTIDIDSVQPVTLFMKLIRVRRLGEIIPVRTLAMAQPMATADAPSPSGPSDDDMFVLETVDPNREEDLDDDE
ncbi:MAG: hypothetical protein AAGF11_20645 [Myxococcota bacterium]